MRRIFVLDERMDEIAVKTGGQKYMSEVLRYLEDRHEIKYIYPKSNSFLKGVKYNFRLKAIYAAFMANKWCMKQSQTIDRDSLVITNAYFRHVFALFHISVKLLRGCKTVLFVNGIYFYSRSTKLLNLLDQALMFVFLSPADLIIANSQATKTTLVKLGIHDEKIRVIYPRLDLPGEVHIKPRLAGKSSVDVLFVGGCDPVKEVHVLIAAIGLVQSPVMLHIVGDDKVHQGYTARLITLIDRYNIADRVKFYGRLTGEDLLMMYTMADIFVSPGSGEGYGRVLIEAMHYGLPVIGANRGGSRELIADGVNGFLFTPGDSHDLKKKIDLLCRDEELRQSMGNEGKRKAATANFTENIGAQFYNVLKSEGLID